MKTSVLFFFVFFCGAIFLYGQGPVIENIEPSTTYPQDTILITGSGFSGTPALLQVWFDQVKGTIVSSTDYSISVKVPTNLRFSTLEVINLNTRLSAKAPLKFTPSYKTAPVSATTFALAQTETNITELWDFCNCDLNNDNKPDIAVTKFNDPSSDLMILENQSTPGIISFTRTEKAMGFPTDAIVCGDLNGDGKPELVTTRSGSTRNTVHILPNTSAGSISFGTTVNLTLEADPQDVKGTRVAINDLNRDGKPDIVVSDQSKGAIYIFVNNSSAGTLTINPTPIKITVAGAASTYEVEVQDFNGDKFPDIVLTQLQNNDIFLLRNLGAESISFAPVQQISVLGRLNRIASVDLNKDGLLDIMATSTLINNQLFILFNQSTTTSFAFSAPVTKTTTQGSWGIDVSDIEGDGDPDVFIVSREQAVINFFTHDGNFATPTLTGTNIARTKNARNIKVGDLDNDGKPDMVLTTLNASAQFSLEILRNTNCHQPAIINDELSICPGQTLRLETMPGNSVEFTWRNGASIVKTGTDHFLDVTTAGTYSVTASGTQTGSGVVGSEVGCALQDSKVISAGTGTMPGKPVITASSPICSGTSLSLSTGAIAGATYEWTGPDGFTSTAQNPPAITNVTAQNAGLYELTVSVGDCHNSADPKIVDVSNLDNFTITSPNPTNTICAGTGSVTLSVQNPSGHTFQWFRNGSPNGDKSITGATSFSHSATFDDSYWVKVTHTSLSCSITTSPVVVKALSPPVSSFKIDAGANLDINEACTGEQLQFTDLSTGDNRGTLVRSWNFGNGSSSAQNPTNIYATAGNFNPVLTVSYSGVTGCSDASDPKPLTINNAIQPVISSLSTAICPGEEASLSVAGSFTSVTWTPGGSGNSITVSEPGTYSVNTVDNTGCPGTDNIVIDAKETPVITITANNNAVPSGSITVSPGSTVLLLATGADNFLWSPAESLDNASIANPKATPATSTIYQVTGTIDGGCTSLATIEIRIDGSKLDVAIPLAFSPNGDSENPTWVINGSENYPDCSVNVFDARGRRIYQQKGLIEWDGTYEGKPVPDGTYYFVYGCPDKRTMTGSVLVFK
jgi:gliding motility-associated-like protein